MVPLFHPRVDRWEDHFETRGGQVCGKTQVGRATVRLLNMNAPRRVELRLATGSLASRAFVRVADDLGGP
jgi:hypothetical protein